MTDGPARDRGPERHATRTSSGAAPFTSNTQLLWYRNDRVPDAADHLGRDALARPSELGERRAAQSRCRASATRAWSCGSTRCSSLGRRQRPRRERHEGRARARSRPSRRSRSCGTCARSSAAPTRAVHRPGGRRPASPASRARRPSWSTTRSSDPSARDATRRTSPSTWAGPATRGIEGDGPSQVTIGGLQPRRRRLRRAPRPGLRGGRLHRRARTPARRRPSRAGSCRPPRRSTTTPSYRGHPGVPVRRPVSRGGQLPVRRRAEGDAGRRGAAPADALLQRRLPGDRPHAAPDRATSTRRPTWTTCGTPSSDALKGEGLL